MLVKGGPSESVFGELLLHIDCILTQNLKVFILQAFGNLKQDHQTFFTDLRIVILQEVDYVFGDSQIKTGLYLVRVTGLEYASDHGQRAPFTGLLKVVIIKTAQTVSERNQLVVVGGSPMHRDQERQGQLVHLL